MIETSKENTYIIGFMFVLITIALIPTSLFGVLQVDEQIWARDVKIWKDQGIRALADNIDNKPITFLAVERILQADRTVMYTRLLNIALIAFISILIYSITKRYESFLFIIIPVFLTSMWLTVEAFELMFVLLSLKYKEYSGIFIGLAVLFRPYAILYSLLLKRRQIIYVLIIGSLFAALLLYLGLFFPYLERVTAYGSETEPLSDYPAVVVLVPMLIIGMRNKEIFKYGLLACVPLILRTWAHYFITPYGLFLTSYLIGEHYNNKGK